ncbi:hypothetical protein ACWFRJ_43885 [Streptomyces sp. NPDC055239]
MRTAPEAYDDEQLALVAGFTGRVDDILRETTRQLLARPPARAGGSALTRRREAS